MGVMGFWEQTSIAIVVHAHTTSYSYLNWPFFGKNGFDWEESAKKVGRRHHHVDVIQYAKGSVLSTKNIFPGISW